MTLKDLHTKAKQELKKLSTAQGNIKAQREEKMKEMEGQVKKAQTFANKAKTELMNLKSRRDVLVAEIKALAQEMAALTEQRSICEKSLQRISGEAAELEVKVRHFIFALLPL